MKKFLTDEEFDQLPDAPDMLSDEEFESLPDAEQAPVEQFESPETGFVEAGIRGAVQGLTFDYGDEIGAFAESAFTGKPYEKALEESRAEYKLAQEEYPATSFLGGVAGGLAQTAAVAGLTGGAGALLPAGKLKKAVEGIRALYLPTTGASALKNIASAAKTGAIMSGITATGASEKEGFESLEDIPEGVVVGGITGGVLGGAVEGVKKGASAVVKKLTKMGEEGNLPYSVKKSMDVIKAGKSSKITLKEGDTIDNIANRYGINKEELEKINGPLDNIKEGMEIEIPGKGYITEKSMQSADKSLMNSAAQGVNLIQTSLDDVRNVKSEILKRVPNRLDIRKPLSNLQKNIKNQVTKNLRDAEPALKDINRLIAGLELDEAGQTSAFAVNNVINQLDNYVFSEKPLSAEVITALKNSADELKLRLRASVDPQTATEVLNEIPEYLDIYKRYVASLPKKELANSSVLSKSEQELFDQQLKDADAILAKLQKKKPKKKISKTIPKEISTPLEELKQSNEKIDKAVLEIQATVNPLGQMDAVMHNILKASENLGKVTRGKGDSLKTKFKLFDIMRGSSSDTGTGQKAAARYESALENLASANPKLAERFKEIVNPSIRNMENKKFLQGAKLGEESKEGLLQAFITAPAKVAGVSGNIVAQVSGKTINPVVATMMRTKNKIDSNLKINPDSALLRFFSKGLETAINEKDASRRAAILNTLSHYKTFRDFNNDEE
jgi:LysM repeat protein